MAYYINNISSSRLLKRDIKELIPDMNMRRRMSSFVKMGVSTGVEVLRDFETSVDDKVDNNVDAIITSTSLGCLADSEKFLKSILENGEQMLNPTPFIQSTFNTIGAQIGLITKNHCYNMTYSQRAASFESAILDAILRIDLGQSENILIGAIDEETPTQFDIFKRLKITPITPEESSQGAIFLVLTKEKRTTSIARLEVTNTINDKDCLKESEHSYNNSFSAAALMFGEMADKVDNRECSYEFLKLKLSKL